MREARKAYLHFYKNLEIFGRILVELDDLSFTWYRNLILGWKKVQKMKVRTALGWKPFGKVIIYERQCLTSTILAGKTQNQLVMVHRQEISIQTERCSKETVGPSSFIISILFSQNFHLHFTHMHVNVKHMRRVIFLL